MRMSKLPTFSRTGDYPHYTVRKADRTLTFAFTKDISHIEEYCRLRKTLYTDDKKFRGFRFFDYRVDETKCCMSENSHLMLVFDQKEVIGGACMTVSHRDAKLLLPLEYDIRTDYPEFRISDAFPDLELDGLLYGEASSLVLHPDFRKEGVMDDLFAALRVFCNQERIVYVFILANLVRARMYQQSSRMVDVPFFVNRSFDVPQKSDYEDEKMYLMSCVP